MSPMISTLCVLVLTAMPAKPAAHFVQVAPVQREMDMYKRSPNQDRAVILIHGLRLSIFSKSAVLRAEFRSWQEENSDLVKRLEEDSDVYSFAYAQNVLPDDVVEVPQLVENIRQLQQLGYKEIVLIGYSAGGLIARQFVEDHPDSGVTKVVQVCAPNGGSSWAKVKAVRSVQRDFLRSLTKEHRRKVLEKREEKMIPQRIEFACIVGTGALIGDGVVSCKSQWPDDLQKQGVPAYPITTTHCCVLKNKKAIERIGEVVREPQPRWDGPRVETARKDIFLGK